MNVNQNLEGSCGADNGGRSAWFSEAEGFLVVRDRQLFRPGFEGFCRRLAESAVDLGGVRSAFVCLGSGNCRIEFEGGRFSPSEMAEWFAEAVRSAVERGRSAAIDGPGGWISLMVFPADGGLTTWETTRERRGSLRLRHSGLVEDRALADRVAEGIAGVEGVAACRVAGWGRVLDVKFDREGGCPSRTLAAAESAYRQALPTVPEPLEDRHPTTPTVATGLRRAGFLALAAGSFGLTVVALIIPGVPTLPFLLATSYCLVRSSPSLNERLLRSTFFGPILADLEFGHGLRWTNKVKLIGFTLAVGLVTVILIVPSWPFLVVMVTVTSASLFAIATIPAITTDPRALTGDPVTFP